MKTASKFARWLLIIIVALLATALLAYAGLLWMMAHPQPTSHRAVLVDLDNDGDLDAALANGVNEGRWQNILWINQGGAQGGAAGAFAASPQRLGDAEYLDLAAADLDSDGDTDLLFGNTWGELHLFINQGGAQGGALGQFTLSQKLRGAEYWGGSHPTALSDLDQDGDLDIFSASCCGGWMWRDNGQSEPLPASVAMWTNQRSAGGKPDSVRAPLFRQIVVPVDSLTGTQALALGDLDSDGDLDAFMAKTSEELQGETFTSHFAYRAWWNDGAGSFTIGQSKLESPSVRDLALGDLDRDGDLDALAGTAEGAQIILNQGGLQGGETGQFALLPNTLGSQLTQFVFLGDLNSDGALDALLGGQGSASVWLNDGFAGFHKAQGGLGYSNRHAIALGDVDNDGDLDVFAARLAESYTVWRNDGTGRMVR